MADKLIPLPNGNLVDPRLIRAVLKFKGKGVALRNEFNKFIDFIAEPDDRRQQIIVDVLHDVISKRDREPPDWGNEFDTAP